MIYIYLAFFLENSASLLVWVTHGCIEHVVAVENSVILIEILSIEVCIPPEEEALASKACGNIGKTVCRCPKQQKATPKDQY